MNAGFRDGATIRPMTRVVAYFGIVPMAGCNAEAVSSPFATQGSVESASPKLILGSVHGRRSWRGRESGRVFTVDLAARSVSDDRGHVRHVTAKAAKQISEAFDSFEQIERFLTRFHAVNPTCKARTEEFKKKGYHAQIKSIGRSAVLNATAPSAALHGAFGGNSPFSSILISPNPGRLSFTDDGLGPDYCTEIELAINALTIQYENLYSYWENLLSNYQPDLVEFLFQIQEAWAYVTATRVQLDFLAIQYRQFGCFHQFSSEPIGGPGLPTGPFTNSAGVLCTREWFQIYVVYDNGLEWPIGDPFSIETCDDYPE